MMTSYRPAGSVAGAWRTMTLIATAFLAGSQPCAGEPPDASGNRHPPTPTIDDASLLRQMPGAGIEYRLPERVFPPELVEKLRGPEIVYRKFMYRSMPNDAPKWTGIPLERWPELIGDFAPVSIYGNTGNMTTIGLSPFTGKPFAGGTMSDEEFLNNPFQARETGTDFVIYAREEDMPANYPARPNHTLAIPHLDGAQHEYRFFVPEAFKDAGPELHSNRKNWFCPAGEVWRCRLGIILDRVIPDLTAAVVYHDDRAAVRTLAAILDRIADVYPGLPLYNPTKAHGFACGPDRRDYLTAEQYRSIAPRQPFIHARSRADYPFWYVDIYDFKFNKLDVNGGGWTDTTMDKMGWIAAAFDLIRDQPETQAFSQARHGAADAFERRFRERCLKELEFLALATPPTGGNTSYAYITGSVKVGIACRNQELFRKGLSIVELYLYSNWSPDGMAGDAAFNYAMMTQEGILGLSWLNTFFGGVDLGERYPLARTSAILGCYPKAFRTLFGVYSRHADQHAPFLVGTAAVPAAEAIDYAGHEAGLCLPFYGLTVLRGGAPGQRTELIVSHQNAFQHSHADRLGYQLFHEGVDCLPDFGYCVGYVDTDKAPWSEVKAGYELLGLPAGATDTWGPWKWGFADKPEAHNAAMVDYWNHSFSGPCLVAAVNTAESAQSPGWWAQMLDVDAAGIFAGRPHPVSIYRRQVAMLTLPGGSPLVVDILRIRGGQRHDLFMHVPADTPEPFLSGGEPIDAPDWLTYLGIKPPYDKLTGKSIHSYGLAGRRISGLKRHPDLGDSWQESWLIQPAKAFPKGENHLRHYATRPERFPDVRLACWTTVAGSPATGEVVSARAPWPGTMTIDNPATGKPTSGTVGLKDALDFRILTRSAAAPGLASTFIRALAPGTPDATPELTGFTAFAAPDTDASGGVACKLTLASGKTGLVATTADGGELALDGVALRGRFAALFPEAWRLALVDAQAFAALGWEVELAPGWEMTLEGVVGDLSGRPEESALIVQSKRPLPTDATLHGKPVAVTHRGPAPRQSMYAIAAISRLSPDRFRIDLKGHPPFIETRGHILKIDPTDSRKMEPNFPFNLPAGWRVRFPRTGFESERASGLTLANTPPPGAVAVGDPYVVFSVQPGDAVRIAPFLFCDGANRPDAEGETRVGIEASGAFRVAIPGTVSFAEMERPDGRRTAVDIIARPKGAGSSIEVAPDMLDNGRGTLRLRFAQSQIKKTE